MAILAPSYCTINAVVDDILSSFESSSLSSGTAFTLPDGTFQPSTDNTLTVLNYRSCKLYDGSSKKANKANLAAQWFVYYSYKNPNSGLMERQKIFRDINTFDSIRERREYARALIKLYNDLLKSGYSPYELYTDVETGDLDKNIISCCEFYLAEKKKSLAPKSYAPYSQHVGYFKKWIEKKKLTYLNIDQIKKRNILQFISDYRDDSGIAGNRQLNNIKDNVSGMFSYFVKNFDDAIAKNPVTGSINLPVITRGNVAYTDEQIKMLKEIMVVDNPNMLFFCEMVYESCTRPHEEARKLIIEDLEFNMNRIRIRPELSKEGRLEFIPMSGQYMAKLKKYVEGYPCSYFIFSINRHPAKKGLNPMRPGEFPVSEWTLQEWYRKVKEKAGMDKNYSIYGWKHSYCVRAYLDTKDVYFIQMKCRHTDLSVTCRYLRNLGLFVDLKMIADTVRSI